jgi:hypothetical protein
MIWNILLGLLMIGAGVGIMGFGLFLFYTFRPLFYAFLGAGIGVWFASLFTGSTSGFLPVVFGIAGAIILALLTNFLAPFARLMLGIVGGILVGLAIASAFGWGTFLAIVLAVIGAVIGVFAVAMFFDPFIIAVTAIAGAAMVMDGVVQIIPGLNMFNRATISTGSWLPLVIWIVLAAVGLGWQLSNLRKWVNTVIREQILANVPPPR